VSDIEFTVEGNPLPKQSYRAKNGGGYTDPRIKAWQDTVAWKAMEAMQHHNILTGDVEAQLIFYRGNEIRVDLDNLSKAVLDGCNGIVWEDDRQIVKLTLEKMVDKKHPHVHVMAWSVEP